MQFKGRIRDYDIPKVSQFMIRKIIFVTPDFDLRDVLSIFNRHGISTVPVLKSEVDKVMVGLVNDYELMKNLGNGLFHDEFGPVMVKDIMKTQIKSIPETMDLFEVEEFFSLTSYKDAPVVDKEGHLIGWVGRRDLLLELEKIMTEVVDYREKTKTPLELDMHGKIRVLISNFVLGTHKSPLSEYDLQKVP